MKFTVLLVLLSLSACAGAGTRIEPKQLSYFVPHETTAAEIRATLGEPNGFHTRRDGSSVLVYSWVRTTLRPWDFIPFIGPFVAGSDTLTKSMTIFIAADGTYNGVSRSEGQVPEGQYFAAP